MKKQTSKKLQLGKIKVGVFHNTPANGVKGPWTISPSICQCDSINPCITQNAGIC